MNWDALDYAAAALLISGGLAAYLVMRRLVASRASRLLAALGIFSLVALIWMHLAVGLF